MASLEEIQAKPMRFPFPSFTPYAAAFYHKQRDLGREERG